MSRTESVAPRVPDAEGYPAEPRPGDSFDARWAAWQQRGRVHERAVRRKIFIIVPVAATVTAIVSAFLMW
jgi:hypothetical protein